MYNKYRIIHKIAKYCESELDKNKDQTIEKLEFELSLLIYNSLKTILLFFIVFKLGILKYTAFYILCIILLRYFSFGVHLENSWACFLWGLVDYIVLVYIAACIQISFTTHLIIFSISFYLLWKYAPEGTKIRPIPAHQYIPLKENTLVVSALLFFILMSFVFTKHGIYANLILFAMVSQTINVLPVTYYIFQQERR